MFLFCKHLNQYIRSLVSYPSLPLPPPSQFSVLGGDGGGGGGGVGNGVMI